MNKLFFLVILAALGGYFSYTHHIKQKRDEPIVYGESRFTLKTANREIELVAIGQRYGTDDCLKLRDLVFEKINAVCGKEDICVESNYQCKDELASSYMGMLDKQEARTHYLHIQRQSDDLKGVILFWGLTDDESLQVCKALLKKINDQNTTPAITQCV